MDPDFTRIQSATLPSSKQKVDVWDHIRAACEHNNDLSERTLWRLDVDWQRAKGKLGALSLPDLLFHISFCWEWWAVAAYRLSYWASHRSLPHLGHARLLRRLLMLQQAALLRFSYLLSKLTEGLSGARLNALADIGPGLLLIHTGSCGIGPGVRIGHTFTLYQDASVMSSGRGNPPVIGDDVILYSGARVIGPVHVGDNVRVGANAVVLHDLPAGCTAIGAPARPVLQGQRPPAYPAWMQLRDLLNTLLPSDLEQRKPGYYMDKAAGVGFTLIFDEPDSESS